jgi:hypothetical protein
MHDEYSGLPRWPFDGMKNLSLTLAVYPPVIGDRVSE